MYPNGAITSMKYGMCTAHTCHFTDLQYIGLLAQEIGIYLCYDFIRTWVLARAHLALSTQI